MARRPKPSLTKAPKVVPFPTQRWKSEEFRHNLQQALIRKGWSQSDLARAIWGSYTDERTGYKLARNRDRIARYVRGVNFPDPLALSQIAKALETTPEDLAPERVGESLAERTPQVSIQQIPGYEDKVHLVIDALVPAKLAAKIYTLMVETDNVSA